MPESERPEIPLKPDTVLRIPVPVHLFGEASDVQIVVAGFVASQASEEGIVAAPMSKLRACGLCQLSPERFDEILAELVDAGHILKHVSGDGSEPIYECPWVPGTFKLDTPPPSE